MTQHGKAISILTEALNFPFAEPNEDTRCVQRMIHTAIPLVSQMVSELYEAQGEIEVLTMWGKAEEMNAADAISERNDLQVELEKAQRTVTIYQGALEKIKGATPNPFYHIAKFALEEGASHEEKLKAAKAWFANETEADPELIGWMGITPDQLIEMWEKET